jgi:hypothetical protein
MEDRRAADLPFLEEQERAVRVLEAERLRARLQPDLGCFAQEREPVLARVRGDAAIDRPAGGLASAPRWLPS